MRKKQNHLGHYALSAEKGMTLHNGEIYTKVYISHADIDEANWTELDDSAVPVDEELTDTEALAIILGGAT